MSGRAWRFACTVGGTAVLLAGCSFGSHSDPSGRSAAPSAAAPPVGSIEHPRPLDCADGTTFTGPDPLKGTVPTSPGPSVAAGPSTGGSTAPSGSPSVRRDTASPSSSPSSSPGGRATSSSPKPSGTRGGASASPSAADVTVGPLTLPGVGALAAGAQRDFGILNGGGWHYRVESLVQPGAVVTVTVGAAQRARAGLEFGGEYGAPTPAVTFSGCPDGRTAFLGAFFVAGDGRACVPVDVRVGDGPARHVVISFFEGHCPA